MRAPHLAVCPALQLTADPGRFDAFDGMQLRAFLPNRVVSDPWCYTGEAYP